RLPLFSGVRRREEAAEHGNDRRLRLANGGHGLITLPAATQSLVERDELLRRGLLRCGILLLELVPLPLGVKDIEEIGKPTLIALIGERHGPLARHQGPRKVVKAILLRAVIADGGVDVLDRREDRALVADELFMRLKVRQIDLGVERAEIEQRPI